MTTSNLISILVHFNNAFIKITHLEFNLDPNLLGLIVKPLQGLNIQIIPTQRYYFIFSVVHISKWMVKSGYQTISIIKKRPQKQKK